MYDLIIIGAGPAGVSAALYAKSRGQNLLVLEKEAVGGLIGKVSKVSHFTSVCVDETGPQFAARLKAQLDAADIPVVYDCALELQASPEGFLVRGEKATYESQKILVATGVRPKDLPVNLPEGVLVQHWALGQEDAVSGKAVVMNGGSDGAAKEALYLAKTARLVHIVQDQEQLLCIDEFKKEIESAKNIVVHCGATLKGVTLENNRIIQVELSNGEILQDPDLQLFSMIGLLGNSEIVKDYVTLENGFVKDIKDAYRKTLFVAGDLNVKAVKQVATAVADGCLKGILAAK